MTTIDEIAVASAKCARCKAWPGERCLTRGGQPAAQPRATRTRAAVDGWRKGYNEGARDSLHLLRRYVERLQNSANLGDPYDQVLDRIKVVQAQYEERVR